jgi:hypothetical protein
LIEHRPDGKNANRDDKSDGQISLKSKGGQTIKMQLMILTARQFMLLQRSTFSKWQARDEGGVSTIKELLAKYSKFIIRSDGALLGITTDSMGRSKRHVLDTQFVDERTFKELQFQFPSLEEGT